ncbi:MAG: c-type cytochrome [Actinomycetota bacterium]
MSDLLAAAAAALGVPETLVQRSAEARAKASGASVDQVLAAWAGGAPAPVAQAEATKAPAAQAPPAAPVGEDRGPLAPESVGATRGPTQPATPVVPATVVAAPPPPRQVSPREALRYPEVVTVPTSGLVERTASAVPRWLAGVFVILPLFGLLQLAGATANDCGQATELAVDRVTGELENCDGSPFSGRGAPGGDTDFIALGSQVYRGQVVNAANCGGCHGPQGQGGVGPAFAGVITTFANCPDHIEWVTKGSPGFQAEGRTTYGDLGKQITANMPSFAAQLTPEQIAAVVAFERVRFAGGAEEAVLADCGLVTTEGETNGASTGTTTGSVGTTGGENGGETATTLPTVTTTP